MQEIVRQVAALEPHVVTLQEAVQCERLRQVDAIAQAIGGKARFSVVDPDSPGGAIGNAVVTTLPILGSRELKLSTRLGDLRAAVRCELETEHGNLSLTTAHLTFELERSHDREEQILLLDEFARRDAGPLPPILTGDLNCTPDSDVVRFLTGKRSIAGHGTYWRDAFHRRHPDSNGYTWSARNRFARRSVERNRRLDYVFVGPMRDDGPGAIRHARVVFDLPGLDDVYASDHFGVFADISLVAPEPWDT